MHPVIPKILDIILWTSKDFHSRVQNTSLKTLKVSNRQIHLILVPGIQTMYREVNLKNFIVTHYKYHQR